MSGGWLPSGTSDDLDIYVDSVANSYFGSVINSVWNQWNGINSNVNIDSKSTTGDPDNYEIIIKGITTLPSGRIAQTTFYDSAGNPVNPALGESWYSAVIECNINSGQLPSKHVDIQKEVILHKWAI